MASSSEEETVVTNGMSEYARDGENANAALVVSVDASDFGSGVLDGVAFQRRLERQAFVLGGKDYRAPAQSVKSYLEAAAPDLSQAATAPSFSCGVREADLHSLFPQPINQMLEQDCAALIADCRLCRCRCGDDRRGDQNLVAGAHHPAMPRAFRRWGCRDCTPVERVQAMREAL